MRVCEENEKRVFRKRKEKEEESKKVCLCVFRRKSVMIKCMYARVVCMREKENRCKRLFRHEHAVGFRINDLLTNVVYYYEL